MKFRLVLPVILFMIFSAHALVPNTDDEAKLLFTERTPRSLNLTLIENSDHTRINKTFWKTDKTGNTYYHIYDNTASKYGLLKIDLSTKEYEFFMPVTREFQKSLQKPAAFIFLKFRLTVTIFLWNFILRKKSISLFV